jgi:acyl dehydratase
MLEYEPIDVSDIERWIGQPIGGKQLKEPVTATDVRRWVQALQNPNPLHYDDDVARASSFGELVTPQSFIIACAINHGVKPALQGEIRGGHHLNGGDEWWFSNNVRIGDAVTSVRQAFDYRLTTTKFAGPTVFQRGDTTYINQRGVVLARQRSTVMRYVVANLEAVRARAGAAGAERGAPTWSDDDLAAIEAERVDYARWVHERPSPSMAEVAAGDRLPRRPIGPHSIQSFTTEQRAYLYTVWGNTFDDGLPTTGSAFGSVEAMAHRTQDATQDPGFGDGLYFGSGRKHTDARFANLVGMPRAFGYGASMSAYILDHVANWAGERGSILHSDLQYRSPVLVGDLTYVDATVAGVERAASPGHGDVRIDVAMTSQTGTVLGSGPVTVRLPMGS